MTFPDTFEPGPAPPGDEHRHGPLLGQTLLGAVILLIGVGWLLQAVGAVDISRRTAAGGGEDAVLVLDLAVGIGEIEVRR